MRKAVLCASILAIAFALAAPAGAEQLFPKPGWENKPDPIASPNACAGGSVAIYGGPSPKSLNYLLDNNTFSAETFLLMYESLLGLDSIIYEDVPALANKWSISDDKKAFTFWINPKAKWSDGKPITAEDVKWSYDAIMNPNNMTGIHKVGLERLESPEILGPLQVRFQAKEVHWQNLALAGGAVYVMPKHVYEKMDFNLINFEFPVVSGPYRLSNIKEGIAISFERRDDYWARDEPNLKYLYNFQTLNYKLFENSDNAFEAFKKRDIDFFRVMSSRTWVEETKGEAFEKNWIVRQKISNYAPVGFQGFCMNMRNAPFDDVRVRKAMALLIDRKRMNETLMYNQYFLLRSYWEDLYDKEHPCPNESVPFDPQQARALLAEAGWKANPQTGGILEKDGKPFVFKFLSRDSSSAKFLNIFAEALKDVGIKMEIDMVDGAMWAKKMDEFEFEMTWASWRAVVRRDPEGMWFSKEATRKAGNNIAGFQNAEVDALIEKQKTIFDINERNAICRQIDKIVFEQHPYALLWNANYTRLLYWNKFGTPRTVLARFLEDNSAPVYWWQDEDSLADLEDAIDAGEALPAKPFDIQFDDCYSGALEAVK